MLASSAVRSSAWVRGVALPSAARGLAATPMDFLGEARGSDRSDPLASPRKSIGVAARPRAADGSATPRTHALDRTAELANIPPLTPR